MLGFLIGTVCLIGLIKTLRRGAYGHGGCGGRAFGGGGWGGPGFGGHGFGGHGHGGPFEGGFGGGSPFREHGGWGRRGGGWGGRAMFLRSVLERIDATPDQEKVIVGALRELRGTAAKSRGEIDKTRADLAKAMRSPAFDEVLLGELFARHDEELESLRKAGVGAMAKIHDALDEKQRGRVADLIEWGPGMFSRWGGRRYDV